MQIRKIIIDEFGALSDREFTLSEGMNIFEGNNESGKSTILSFIRFMFYGMPRKASGTVTERDRGISWGGSVAGGSLEVAVPDKSGNLREYRIERHGQLRGASGHENYAEALKIIDLATGTEVFEGQEPGKALIGLSQETFVSTACIRQLECSDVDGTGVNASIENLLFTANEGINTEKVLAKMDDVRKNLLHKNGKGGRIFELDEQKAELEKRLVHAKEQTQAIIAKEAAVESAKKLENELTVSLRECEDTINLYEACAILLRFNDLHTRENSLEEIDQSLARLDEQKGFPGEFPTRDTVASTEALLRELSDASATLTMREAELAKATSAPDGDRSLASYADTIESKGGGEALAEKFRQRQKRQKKSKTLGALSLVFGLLVLLLGGLGIVVGLSFDKPLLNVPFFINIVTAARQQILPLLGQNPTVFLVIFGALCATGLALSIVSVILFVNAKKFGSSLSYLTNTVGLSSNQGDVSAFLEHTIACVEHRQRSDAYDEALAKAKRNAEAAQASLAQCINKCKQVLSALCISFEQESVDSITEALRAAIASLSYLCREKERLENDKNNLSVVINSLKENVKNYNENTLRSAIGNTDPKTLIDTTNIEKLQFARRYQKEQFAAATSKRVALEKEWIALTAAAENPTKIATKLNEVSEQMEEMRFQHQSVAMAMEALSEASESLRRSITPRIREKAGAFMARFTNGKYCELGISPEMTVNVFAGNATRSIDALSKGTRDAAYLSLRMALADLVSPGNPLTLTMDEGLSLLDEDRAARVLRVLHEYAEQGGQCILFTCHKREAELMRGIGKYQHIRLS